MEEEKAAAYYDELTRKGGGAAKFKQGLGFSSASNDAVPSRGSALPSSSLFSNFVKASSPSESKELEKQVNIESIQSKLKKKPKDSQTDSSFAVLRDKDREKSRSSRRSRSRSRDKPRRRSRSRDSGRNTRRRSRSRSRDGSRRSKRRSRSRSRDRERHSRRRSRSLSRDSDRNSRRRSRDDSRNGHSNHRDRRRSRDRDDHEPRRRRDRSRSRSRSRSRESERLDRKTKSKSEKVDGNGGVGSKVDYENLIEGYDKMTPAERVKAKMKLQLSETVQKDETKGAGSGWERFNFDKDAPLDDEEIEAAEDDTALVKHIGQSFRYSAIESRREDQIKAAHDEAMFGAPSISISAKLSYDEREDSELPVVVSSLSDQGDTAEEEIKKEDSQTVPWANLISAQALSTQQGSWRDRVRKL